MSDEKHPPAGAGPTARQLREQRLAEALRANLRKRKAQSRGRRQARPEQSSAAQSSAAQSSSAHPSSAVPSAAKGPDRGGGEGSREGGQGGEGR